MTAINPNINVSYPLPGQNNSSQGFRDNFTAISTAFSTANVAINDLENKVLLKSALTGTTLNNDMNNALILNAQTLGFRASTYNLGTNLTGTVDVDCTLGDVQYGTIVNGTGAISMTFSKWAPAGTWASVQVILTVSPGDVITLPIGANGVNYGLDSIEGFNGTSAIVVPAGVTRLHYIFGSQDCGANVEIVSVDRPRIASQIKSNQSPTISYVLVTGATITAATNSAIVTGVGTAFTADWVGRVLKDSTDAVIGTIQSYSSATSVTLVANAAVAVSGGTFKVGIPTGTTGDVKGDIMTDGTYLYVCSQNYDAQTPNWKRIALSAY